MSSPVSKYSMVRLVVALMASNGWTRISLDVETAFLNACLEQEVYVS